MKLWKMIRLIWSQQPQGKIVDDDPPRGGYYVEVKGKPLPPGKSCH